METGPEDSVVPYHVIHSKGRKIQNYYEKGFYANNTVKAGSARLNITILCCSF
jgi:hypothetical protein